MEGTFVGIELCESRKSTSRNWPQCVLFPLHPTLSTENSDDSQMIFTGQSMCPVAMDSKILTLDILRPDWDLKMTHFCVTALRDLFSGDGEVLLKGIHETRDGAVQIFVRTTQLFDLIDGVQHGGVVLATELPADFRQRGGGELLDDVHGHLAWKSNGARVTTYL